MNTNDWVIKEFADAPFADDRLNKRLIKIANSFYDNPESSIPQACKNYSATEVAYRFFSNKRVKPEAILMGHREQTIERMKKHDTVLIIQDTTTISYMNHPATKGLGTYRNLKTDLGFLNHTALAITADGVPLGILSRQTWTRDPNELGKRPHSNKLPTSEKESQKWLTALDESMKDVPRYINAVTVCDREADVYDFINKAIIDGRHLLVRVKRKDRLLNNGKFLIEEIESQTISGHFTVDVPRDAENKRPPRKAELSIRYCPVTIQPPIKRNKKKLLPNLNLYLVLAEESTPLQGVEPIYWLLLTTLPVETFEQAVEKVSWYKQRWKIERYHFVLKSGCKVEELQLESVESLQNALALYSIIAWKLLWIKLESEQNPKIPCDIALQEHEWKALYCVTNQTPTPPLKPPTMEEAILMVAKLGGFLARKRDGKPGVKVIWRGLMALHYITQGWLAANLPTPFQ